MIASAQSIKEEGTEHVARLWEVDPSGKGDSRLVAGSVEGDSDPAFAADGTLLFLSARENADGKGVSLWALSERGAARRIAHHPGGVFAFTSAAHADAVAYTADLLPGAADTETYAAARREREDAMVTAALYEETATSAWSAALGPDEPHTFVLRSDRPAVIAGSQGPAGTADVALSPDGSLVACTRAATGRAPDTNTVVVADAATGMHRRTFSRPGHQYYAWRSRPTARPWSASASARRHTTANGTSRSSRSTWTPAKRPTF
ncbi:hypothetical protein [Streptomyces sp. NPDC046727]|uniref:hypothetical protein n=1 Tax=Streptomyces sp. NPDC046727 TaxID=3155373 RepID=UPI0034097718